MSNAFSFAEEEQSAIIGFYEQTVEELDNSTKDFLDALEELCKKVHYMPFVQFANACIDFQNEDLRVQVLNQFQEWIESDGCLSGFIRTMDGGVDAEETAKRLEADLEQKLQEHFPIRDPLSIDTSTPNIDESGYEELSEINSKYEAALESLQDESRAKLEHRWDENNAYRSIQGVIAATLSGAVVGAGEVLAKVDDVHELFVQRSKEQSEQADTVAEELGARAREEAQSLFEAASAKFGGEL